MPEMDGLEATFRIREEERKCARLSGQETCSEAESCQNESCTGSLHKTSVPIWAISACCDDEQWQSPVLAYLKDDKRKGAKQPSKTHSDTGLDDSYVVSQGACKCLRPLDHEIMNYISLLLAWREHC